MSRKILYLAIALVPAQSAGPQNLSNWRQQPLNPEVFARPFPAAQQQFFTTGGLGPISTVQPDGWRHPEWDTAFKKPVPASEQPYEAQVAERVPQAVDAQGFFGQQFEYKFAKPFPAPAQQFQTFTRGPVPSPTTPQGWYPQPPDRFAKPFPVASQQFTGTFKEPSTLPPTGWRGFEYSLQFAKPYPIGDQPFTSAPEPEPFPPPNGWWGIQYDYAFVKPFPVTEQLFSVWDLVGDVPPFLPPGAGKYPKIPSYVPQPAYDAKPNKPVRPVWDKPKQGEIEEHPVAQAPQPIPLPPASLFAKPAPQGLPPVTGTAPFGLPDFNNLVPPDPAGLEKRMQEARDLSDAIAVLKALGLYQET